MAIRRIKDRIREQLFVSMDGLISPFQGSVAMVMVLAIKLPSLRDWNGWHTGLTCLFLKDKNSQIAGCVAMFECPDW